MWGEKLGTKLFKSSQNLDTNLLVQRILRVGVIQLSGLGRNNKIKYSTLQLNGLTQPVTSNMPL